MLKSLEDDNSITICNYFCPYFSKFMYKHRIFQKSSSNMATRGTSFSRSQLPVLLVNFFVSGFPFRENRIFHSMLCGKSRDILYKVFTVKCLAQMKSVILMKYLKIQ